MTLRAERFDLSKGQTLGELVRFFTSRSLDRTQILLAAPVQLSPGNAALLLIYDDTTPPRVIGTSPANAASGVPVGSEITILMSENIADPSGKVTIRRDAALLSPGVDYTILPSPWPAAGSSLITIQNAVDQSTNASYVVSLAETLEDLVGNPMDAPHVFSFTTASQIAGLVLKAGTVTPSSGDISNGYVDVSFGTAFADANYRMALALVGGNTQPGVVLRVSSKTSAGFRVYFDGEDFSTVESGLASEITGAISAVDSAHKTQFNAQHAAASHADPDNQLTSLATSYTPSVDVTGRLFQPGNSIEWIAIYGA